MIVSSSDDFFIPHENLPASKESFGPGAYAVVSATTLVGETGTKAQANEVEVLLLLSS